MDEDTPATLGNRYVILDTVGRGGMGIVYRVRDRLTGDLLALKKVTKPANALEFTMLASLQSLDSFSLALANEFQILAHLRHPNIVSVLDYGFDADMSPYFTMDLIQNPRTITEAAQGQPQAERVRLLIELLEALAYLHRRAVIHRDLKPQNVLVDMEGQVRALDFGLALSEKYARQTTETMQGTYAYLAPEVIRGEDAQLRTDLYGFGLIAYEVLGGDFPYDLSNLNDLLRTILNDAPDLSRFDSTLAYFLGRLLAKSPDDRYQNVDETIQALCKAANYAPPHETAVIREGYLQTATLAGRQTEMDHLIALMRAAQDGQGAICLIAGESGVGKSRLLEEVRIHALVQNMLVMEGQEIAEGGNPYQVWRGVAQWLCLTTDLTELEAQVLKALIPNISDILEIEVANAPELSGQAAQDRLLNVIVDIFRRQQKPTIVLLEDLQWAGQESIRLLNELAQVVSKAHLLILGSYRHDEAPHFAEQVPRANVLHLDRLDQDALSEIIQSVSGLPRVEPQVLAFVQRETEGNAFFVIETVRALADATGALRKISSAPVNDPIVTGGVVALLKQRLNRVPEDARRLLRYAAIIGREIDLRLLGYLAPQADLQHWLITCANRAVLEAEENHWHFAHDKLREVLIHSFHESDTELQSLHAQVASSIETVYGDQETYIAALAHHWSSADVAEKAVYYLEKAALQARIGAPVTVIGYVQKALEFDARIGKISSIQSARRHSLLGNAYYALGDYKQAEFHLQTASEHLGISVTPTQNLPLLIGVFQQIGIQFLHRRLPSRYLGRRSGKDVDSSIYTALFNKQVVYSYQGNMLKVLHASLVALNTVETWELSEQTNPVMAYAALTLASGLMGVHSLAAYYRRLTNAVLPNAGTHQKVLSRALLGIYAAQQADWEEALETIPNVVQRFNAMGAFHSADESTSYLGHVHAHVGNYERALELMSISYKRTKQRNDPIIRFHLYVMLVVLLIRQNNLATHSLDDKVLLDDISAAEVSFKEAFNANVLNRGVYHAMRALYFVSDGNYEAAFHALKESAYLSLARKIERSVLYFEAYALLAQVSLQLLESNELASADHARAGEIFEDAVIKLSKYAKTFKLAGPRASLYQGWQQHHGGKLGHAYKLWQDAVRSAQALQMPYDAGLAHAALAQCNGISEAERLKHEQESQQLFEQLGVMPYLRNRTDPGE